MIHVLGYDTCLHAVLVGILGGINLFMGLGCKIFTDVSTPISRTRHVRGMWYLRTILDGCKVTGCKSSVLVGILLGIILSMGLGCKLFRDVRTLTHTIGISYQECSVLDISGGCKVTDVKAQSHVSCRRSQGL